MYVDTGPVVERVYAKYAGLGWFGKNACLLNKRLGCWLLLGVLVLTVPLDIDHPMPDHCGTCARCQDVCPWNRKRHFSAEPGLQPRPQHVHPDLEELARLTPETFRQRFRGTALERPKRRGLLRNICVAMGNSGNRAFIPVLEDLLQDDEPLIHEHAAWALDRLRGDPPQPSAGVPTRPSRT